MKKIDIFIRTYSKDLEWLQYCLKSIQKFVTGYNDIIICIPAEEAHLIEAWNLTKERIERWHPVNENGYIDQQINKLTAGDYSEADVIVYVDSDVCFHTPVDLNELLVDGKPVLLKTRYESVGDAICWKEPTEEIMGFKVDFEYMRRLPMVFNRSTIKSLYQHLDFSDISKRDRLSEFNLLGAFAEHYEVDQYHIIDTEKEALPRTILQQHWSWGGLTNDIRKKLEETLA